MARTIRQIKVFFFSGQGIKNFVVPAMPVAVWQTGPGGPDPLTGNIVFDKTIGVDDASNFDEFTVTANGAVLQWFTAIPDSGKVEITPTIRIGNQCKHQGSVYDEYYDSNLFLRQRMRMYARVLASLDPMTRKSVTPKLQFANPFVTWDVFDLVDEDQETHDWKNNAWLNGLGPGQTKVLPSQVLPNGSFATGSSVLVEFGVLFENHFTSDDCEVLSSVRADVTVLKLQLGMLPFA